MDPLSPAPGNEACAGTPRQTCLTRARTEFAARLTRSAVCVRPTARQATCDPARPAPIVYRRQLRPTRTCGRRRWRGPGALWHESCRQRACSGDAARLDCRTRTVGARRTSGLPRATLLVQESHVRAFTIEHLVPGNSRQSLHFVSISSALPRLISSRGTLSRLLTGTPTSLQPRPDYQHETP